MGYITTASPYQLQVSSPLENLPEKEVSLDYDYSYILPLDAVDELL
jgi:hypothetical protein